MPWRVRNQIVLVLVVVLVLDCRLERGLGLILE
jgi:hypothetical protein